MMLSFGSLAFLNPWVLAGLVALPVLWWLLRAIPPSPKRVPFAAVRLLLGLEDPEKQVDKTPVWLLVLRALAIAGALVGFARPVLNPSERLVATADGPVLVLMDQGWASAPDWAMRQAAAGAALDEAREAGREVLFWPLGTGSLPPLAAPDAVRGQIEGLTPAGWAPERAAVLAALEDGTLPAIGQTVWLHDGIEHAPGDGNGGGVTAALLERLAEAGPLRLVGPAAPAPAVTVPRLEEGRLAVDILRAGGPAEAIRAVAVAENERGAERRIAVADADFAEGETAATAIFELPPELVRTVTRVAVTERPSAGGAALATGAIRRVPVGVVDPAADSAVVSLTSASHYLRKAIQPYGDVREGTLAEVLEADPSAIVLADHGDIADQNRDALRAFVEEEGGLLVRFAGPRLAAAISEGNAAIAQDPLLPVALRRGGRVLGGALAWSSPRSLGPFDPEGVFRRLDAPGEVAVRTQVLAQPGPDLSGRVWATLEDGTPLVTGKTLGAGHVVLFHVTADAEWSSLPLSGLFVEMLGRLLSLAPGQAPAVPEAEALAGSLWRASLEIGADGVPRPPAGPAEAVAGERLADLRAGPGLPPGLYARADQGTRRPGEATELVISVAKTGDTLAPMPPAPSGAVTETLGGKEAQPLGAIFLTAAVALALADIIATLIVSGRLALPVRGAAAVLALAVLAVPRPAEAQEVSDAAAVEATAETTLGYVLTGNPRLDRISERGLHGLGYALGARTAVEPGPPVGVDPASDVLAFYPVLYWPLTADTLPGPQALANLGGYLTGGGLLLIDTQSGSSGFSSASAAQMRQVARALNLPPLEPVGPDHVLTRAFYLLDRFPGRWRGGQIWAEAPPLNAQGREVEAGMPHFDRVDDNVSPVVVGSADWASAWAIDDQGNFLFPVGRSGDRQREMALRFGVNLVLYALTGNYKSDQVHAPEVLRRLGQ